MAALLALLAAPVAVSGQNIPIALAPGEVLMQVQASGEARTRPDVMSINAGVVTTGQTAKAAVAANNTLANRLLDAVRGQGVAPKDVQTQELSVRPQFDRTDETRASETGRPPRIVGYIATNNLTLTLRDLGKAPDIVDALFEAGANNVQGPNFSLSHPEPAQAEARRAAVAAARAQADEYASALGMRVSRVLRVSERGAFEQEARNGTIMVTGSRIPRTPLEPGEITTRITVWIDFAMVPAR
ncbi:MAG TPA: SIMPL domain-containing protein [Allosphingosinicella sp.]|nr:SIMPL domain-containing protein [Allosphingosinicella sp.]